MHLAFDCEIWSFLMLFCSDCIFLDIFRPMLARYVYFNPFIAVICHQIHDLAQVCCLRLDVIAETLYHTPVSHDGFLTSVPGTSPGSQSSW